jgi:hypothetical protein
MFGLIATRERSASLANRSTSVDGLMPFLKPAGISEKNDFFSVTCHFLHQQ